MSGGRLTRAASLAAFSLVAACSSPPARGPGAAVAWLIAQQRPDGSFRSHRDSILRAGHSTTALAMLALMHAPREQHRSVAPAIGKALDFLAQHGVVPHGDDATVDYPTYTAACWLWVLGRLHPKEHEGVAERLVAFLRTRQLSEDAGWSEADPEYGGFDFGKVVGAKPRGGATANVGTTSWVIQACRAAGLAADDPLLRRARTFVLRCQVWALDDPLSHGGFVHSPVNGPAQSKAGLAADGSGRALPYASTTCDGLAALAALDERGTPAGAAAAAWLVAHAKVPEVGGFERAAEATHGYERALRVYSLAALARVLPLLPPDPAREAAIVATWSDRQRDDGSVVGWTNQWKEEDPLIATCLALRGWPAAK